MTTKFNKEVTPSCPGSLIRPMMGEVVAQRARAEVLLESIARKGSKRVRERQCPAPRTKGIERRKAGSGCVTQSGYEMGTARLQAGQMGYAKKTYLT